LYAQALLYVASGVNHFWHRELYVRIMPDHYARPDVLVELSGVAEMVGGAGLLIPATRRVSAVGLAAMLLTFLDVHVYMLRHSERFPGVPVWMLWARVPLQGLLIAWALHYARRRNT
jgi:uncharacterized membrane protein